MLAEYISHNVTIFGVDYTHIRAQGDLYVTPLGLPYLKHLLPANWNDKKYYAAHPEKKLILPGSGKPYRVETQPVDGKSIRIVVKWCRIGTDTLISKSPRMDFIADEDVTNATWNGPFQEFGLLQEFRNTNQFFNKRIRTQRPLAIFSPEERTEQWRTGRHRHSFDYHNQLMRRSQSISGLEPIELDIQRLYAMLYGWVEGEDAGVVFQRFGMEEQIPTLVRRVYEEDIQGRGYSIADTKPDHLIVRCENGDVLRDDLGNVIYALIDFELLRRTKKCEQIHKRRQRAKYWNLMLRQDEAIPLPGNRKRVNIFGVDYVYGDAGNGGKLWVVGKNPELFDYFEPEKWRRTPRSKLSLTTFRTTTVDHIKLVYKESRVKLIPPGEPDSDICHFGYNSPFEEVAVAIDLQKFGIPVSIPRAIYRTAHESYPAEFLEDSSRIESHKHITIDGEPILSDNHDYMILFGLWRGIDPLLGYKQWGHWGIVDVEQAFEMGMISETERIAVITDTRERLLKAGFSVPIRDDRFVMFTEHGKLRLDRYAKYDITISIDGNRAYRRNLLTKEQFKHEMFRLSQSLDVFGYKPLDLRDSHVLFTMNPDGALKWAGDSYEKVLCNFELIRPPWFRTNYGTIAL